MKRRTAFTLIELLVVIAIIAILAAILFPVFAQAKESAKKAQDLSNHKQIVTAIMLYSNDYDDRVCHTHHDLETGQTIADLYTWFDPLQPYIKNKQIFRDPDVNSTPSIFPTWMSVADWKPLHTDYLINGFFAHGASLTEFDRVAEQIIIAERHERVGYFDYHPWASAPDGQWERGFLDGSGYVLSDVGTDAQVLDPKNTGRHLGGNNYSFADGHAKWYKFVQTLDKSKAPDAIDNVGLHNIDNKPPVD
ncbi:MAG: prepilin-type N-terminal cleavage/methylation domain-containing protein [Armatimonadetes bacterium]|nr:prepilin-type N-terminal cleavage/methylation domain-containing protein [Armatimonadota bacterium]MBS1712276.1 prepilin-type N-terminal cleavage/methylation domain-containing protein [Armatimonadota bacterium]MBX3107983.1 prepilin-type N-terminal cleavage/methylation domain-containing protein [Fimbriimonadaceae bacterium]